MHSHCQAIMLSLLSYTLLQYSIFISQPHNSLVAVPYRPILLFIGVVVFHMHVTKEMCPVLNHYKYGHVKLLIRSEQIACLSTIWPTKFVSAKSLKTSRASAKKVSFSHLNSLKKSRIKTIEIDIFCSEKNVLEDPRYTSYVRCSFRKTSGFYFKHMYLLTEEKNL